MANDRLRICWLPDSSGGPAGLETARRLAQKGHEVMLLEQSDRLGGTAQFAAMAYQPNERVVEWLRRHLADSLRAAGFNVHTAGDCGGVAQSPGLAGADERTPGAPPFQYSTLPRKNVCARL